MDIDYLRWQGALQSRSFLLLIKEKLGTEALREIQ